MIFRVQSLDRGEIARAARGLGLSGRAICVHASLSSFGHVRGGARAVLDGLLDVGATVLAPTFTDLHVPAETRPPRNGWDYDRPPVETRGLGLVYTPDTSAVAPRMGALARAVVDDPKRVRGDHALCSFAAVGPAAEVLVSCQSPAEVFAPLEALEQLGGDVVLMGVGLERATLLHLAEQRAGRGLFRRWANGRDGRPAEWLVGGCSRGFPALGDALGSLARIDDVGASRWRALPARETVAAAAAAIRNRPALTRCEDPTCIRCEDALAGGPPAIGLLDAAHEEAVDA